MRVTIKDLAKISGFGLGTVSRVLNGSSAVSDTTREKVLEVARRLKYKPNKTAKMLVTGQYNNSTIGIILPKITHKFSLKILEGIYSCLNERGYSLLIFNVGKQREEIFRQIMYTDFTGLLALVDPLTENEKLRLKEHNNKFIYLDLHEKGENSIYFDNFHGGSLAADYLIAKGCKHIAFIGDLSASQQEIERLSGFKGQLETNQMDLKSEYSISLDKDEAYRLTSDLIKQGDIDGIFYYCDILALGGLQAKKELNSSIHIIGYDDISPTEYVNLSTVRQDGVELGKLGAQQIVDLIERVVRDGESSVNVCLEPELVDRGS
ncbi:MAG: LacI family DNA-binding transcriptional regulator [Bacteroidetes bacterium]|nr:LacI family DNA-binding transcriptional regulator [Bacteroidota bacterium]